jgi:serine protease Do
MTARMNPQKQSIRLLIPLLLALLLLTLSPSVVVPAEKNNASTDEGIQAAERLAQSFRSLAEAVRPSVVAIDVTRSPTPEMRPLLRPDSLAETLREFFGEEYFGRFFRNRRPGQAIPYPEGAEQRYAQGSGVIVSEDGYILTNHHIVAGMEQVSIKLHDGKTLKAKVVGSDRRSDLALLRVESKTKLQPAKLGDSDKVHLCDWVLAIGSPYGLDYTVVHGLISAKGKGKEPMVPYEEFLQTDAPIQAGNSGGPLVNLHGEVIGICTARFSQPSGGQTVNFAIPINLAKKAIKDFQKQGRSVRGWLGIGVQNLTPDLAGNFGLEEDARGVLVSHVEPNSPAEKGGLERGDVITRFQNKDVTDAQSLRELVGASKPGTEIKLRVLREGKEKSLTVRVGETTAAPKARKIGSADDKHPFGFRVKALTPELAKRYGLAETKGVIVQDIEPGSIADLAGLRPGALILEANRKKVDSVKEFQEALKAAREPNTLLLLVRQDEVTEFVILKQE